MNQSNTRNSYLFLNHLWELLGCFLLMFICFVLPVDSIAANLPPTKSIKIGVLAKRGPVQALNRWVATAEYLTQAIPGQHFEIVPLDFESVHLATMSHSIDFLITNSSYYVLLEADHGLTRVATMVNLHGDAPQQVFGGVIFTRSERSDINTLKDLMWKSFWAVDQDSLGGWLAAWREFHAQGIRPDRDLRLLKFAGTHDAVVTAVLNGTADAGTVRTDTLEEMAEEGKILLSDVKVLNRQTKKDKFNYFLSTRLYPEWPFAALSHTTDQLRNNVAHALLSMPSSSQAAQAANINGWTEPHDYQPIYNLLKEWHLSLYKKYVGEMSLADAVREHWPTVLLLILLICLLVVFTGYTFFLNKKLEQRVEERTRKLIQETADRKGTEEKLYRAEKMEAIGLMASGVAHDLNNILSGIVSYPELLLMRLPDDSELRQPINIIRESGLRAAAVVDDLLTVARGAAKVHTRLNINMLVQEFLQSPEADKIRSLYPQTLITTELMSEKLAINCSPIHVKKCIMNLVLNAAEAIGISGEIHLCTEVRELPEDWAASLAVAAGRYVILIVSDNGPGIPIADQKHIFEPFYTKKKMGRSGTGIGLAIVWSCMQDHAGTVAVQSSDNGTIFTLYFPAENEAVNNFEDRKASTDTDVALILKGNGERILVVDDEAQQRDIAMKVLTELGYQTETVSSGESAIEHVVTEPVELLLLDMAMDPGIDGLQTYKKIKEIYPHQKALIVSGFSEDKKVKEALSVGVGGFLKKPYTIDQIATSVKKALSE
ncbi:MAG: PhnD/SsuA/transferrin family substrate-binding protein [Desulfuromusa sp.]